MSQTFEMNQFALSQIKGTIAYGLNTNVLSARIKSDSASTFVGGSAVKIVDVASDGLPIIDKASATDKIFGFIVYNKKGNVPTANQVVDVAFDNSIINLEASASIAGGALLEIVASGDTVITNAGTNTVVGRALKKASSGDIIPVLVFTSRT